MGLDWVVIQMLCCERGAAAIHSVTKHFLNTYFPRALVVH